MLINSKKRITIMRHLIISSLGLLLVQRLAAEPELKGTATELAAHLASIPGAVVITAEGEANAQADKATITLRVVTEGKGLQPAIKANQEVRTRLVSLLKERGVSEDQIKGSRFSSTPKHSVFSEKAKGYRVENQLKVTVLDDREFQAVALAADALPEIHYAGIEFDHSDKERLKGKAVAQACDRALNEKKVYEEKLGVKLAVKRFSTLNNPTPADLRRANPDFEKTATITGIVSDPAFRGTIHALEQREDSTSLFGEISAKVLVTFEFVVESR